MKVITNKQTNKQKRDITKVLHSLGHQKVSDSTNIRSSEREINSKFFIIMYNSKNATNRKW